MKTFLLTLGLTAFLALAISPARIFAQDDTGAPTPIPDQGQNPNAFVPAGMPNQPQNQAPAQGQTPAPNNNSVTFQDFYNQLSSYGNWIQTDNYGYVWQPTENDPNWQPYTYGHWVNTNAGMMWSSNEPFGWATYHYGRWVNLANQGWVWVPGYTWAPAWVSWRDGDSDSDGDDYVGWAPLPPDTLLGIDFFDSGFFGYWFGTDSGWGFHIGDDCDLAYGIGPACYNFCPVAYLGDPAPWRHFAHRGDNFALINHTRNVTNLNVSNDPHASQFGRVHSDGPGSATLARSHTPFQTERLTPASSLAANDRRSGNSLAVYAPSVGSDPAARPSGVSANLGNVAVNRGTDINQPLAVNSHLSGAAPTSAQINAASLAAGNAPSSTRIARTNTTFSHALSQPLTSYHPGTTAGTASASTFHASSASSPASTGESATHHTSTPSGSESAFTGATATHHAAASSEGSSFFSEFFHHSASSGNAAHVSDYHSSFEPTYHSSVAPSFHSSESVYHSEPSFHSAASAMHFGGGAPAAHFGGGAPSMHFGGGAPAAHFSGGGGHSSGGSHPSGGGNPQHH